jgi:hypothetical protein
VSSTARGAHHRASPADMTAPSPADPAASSTGLGHGPTAISGHGDPGGARYLHADLELKEKALAKTTPANTKPGRYKPPDQLLTFLESL